MPNETENRLDWKVPGQIHRTMVSWATVDGQPARTDAVGLMTAGLDEALPDGLRDLVTSLDRARNLRRHWQLRVTATLATTACLLLLWLVFRPQIRVPGSAPSLWLTGLVALAAAAAITWLLESFAGVMRRRDNRRFSPRRGRIDITPSRIRMRRGFLLGPGDRIRLDPLAEFDQREISRCSLQSLGLNGRSFPTLLITTEDGPVGHLIAADPMRSTSDLRDLLGRYGYPVCEGPPILLTEHATAN